jgi:excisionase family DNA binding protein
MSTAKTTGPKRGATPLVAIQVGKQTYRVPRSFISVVKRIASGASRGMFYNVVTSKQDDDTVTTDEAAKLLGVSRPYVVKLTETKALPHTMKGDIRQIPLRAVLKFREKLRKQRAEGLRLLAALDREYGLE